LGGYQISFLKQGMADANHLVIQFPSSDDAAKAYKSHHFTRNTTNTQWELLNGFAYASQIADQFRVVCDTRARLVASCIIEAQYDEFLSVINYGGLNQSEVISDLTLLANAVDSQVAKYIESGE